MLHYYIRVLAATWIRTTLERSEILPLVACMHDLPRGNSDQYESAARFVPVYSSLNCYKFTQAG